MAQRSYETDHITVRWDSTRCIHSGVCLRALPEVFDTSRRPWVDVAAADADAVAAAIDNCPSGALTYERLDGVAGELVDEVTTIVPKTGGPLYVRGNVRVFDSKGAVLGEGPRLTLCRCGASKNQPFCDLSHRDIKFRDTPRSTTDQREQAGAPSEVTD